MKEIRRRRIYVEMHEITIVRERPHGQGICSSCGGEMTQNQATDTSSRVENSETAMLSELANERPKCNTQE